MLRSRSQHVRFVVLAASLTWPAATHAQSVTWTNVTPGPGPRTEHAMAYDSTRGVSVVFGGYQFGRLGDTWEWDGSEWTLRTTVGPSPRNELAMAYDSARGVCVLFGGDDGSE